MLTSQLNEGASNGAPHHRNILLVYPRFSNDSFWNYRKSCEVVGARYPTIPLGLITVASMLPPHWDVRLVNCNTEDLLDEAMSWARHINDSGRVALLVEGDDGTRLTKQQIVTALKSSETAEGHGHAA